MSILGSIGMGDSYVMNDKIKYLQSFNHKSEIITRKIKFNFSISDIDGHPYFYNDVTVCVDNFNDKLVKWMEKMKLKDIPNTQKEAKPIIQKFLSSYFNIKSLYVVSAYIVLK